MGFLLGLLNIKKMIGFAVKNWKPLLIGGMAFIIWYQNFNETRFLFGAETIPSLVKQLEAAVIAVDVCKAGNDTLSQAIDDRNTEVEEWKNISKGLEGDIAVLQQNLDIARKNTQTQVDIILKDTTPKTCKAAIDYLRDGRKDLQWEN